MRTASRQFLPPQAPGESFQNSVACAGDRCPAFRESSWSQRQYFCRLGPARLVPFRRAIVGSQTGVGWKLAGITVAISPPHLYRLVVACQQVSGVIQVAQGLDRIYRMEPQGHTLPTHLTCPALQPKSSILFPEPPNSCSPIDVCRSVYRDQYLKELMQALGAGLARNARLGAGLAADCLAQIAGATRETKQEQAPAKLPLFPAIGRRP